MASGRTAVGGAEGEGGPGGMASGGGREYDGDAREGTGRAEWKGMRGRKRTHSVLWVAPMEKEAAIDGRVATST